ncbi:MAG: Uma2 family endonuclease [Microscillaceae bacterium]|jgi:Uma2 family endonuclease|nr:Uma2 family endonuclease [Microscillaceae bacterium]
MLIKTIPEALIYEMANGKPIYYRGYKEVLEKRKKIEEIMSCSSLQALLIARIIKFLNRSLDDNLWEVFTNEMGVQIKKGVTRACDIAIFEKAQLADYQYNDKLFSLAPKIVIEVDTKADMEDETTPLDYYFKKTQELLDFGVEKLLWITTESQKIMLAMPNHDWITSDWNTEVEIVPNLKLNVAELIK